MKIESARRMKIVGQTHRRPLAARFCFISSILWSATLSKNALKFMVIWGHSRSGDSRDVRSFKIIRLTMSTRIMKMRCLLRTYFLYPLLFYEWLFIKTTQLKCKTAHSRINKGRLSNYRLSHRVQFFLKKKMVTFYFMCSKPRLPSFVLECHTELWLAKGCTGPVLVRKLGKNV